MSSSEAVLGRSDKLILTIRLSCVLDLETRAASFLHIVANRSLTQLLDVIHVGKVGLDATTHDRLLPRPLPQCRLHQSCRRRRVQRTQNRTYKTQYAQKRQPSILGRLPVRNQRARLNNPPPHTELRKRHASAMILHERPSTQHLSQKRHEGSDKRQLDELREHLGEQIRIRRRERAMARDPLSPELLAGG